MMDESSWQDIVGTGMMLLFIFGMLWLALRD